MITKLFSGKFNVWLILMLLLTACGQKQQGVSDSTATSTPVAAESQSSQTAPSPTPTEPIKAVPIEFTDVTAQAGIKFRHNNGAYGKKYFPETTGSGCHCRRKPHQHHSPRKSLLSGEGSAGVVQSFWM